MEMSELIAFAREKYHIDEQHKWSDFPGFSVLCHPETGKWAALLMRQWDTETGCEIERCDIRCGSDIPEKIRKPYLSAPFRMHGRNWVGIAFDKGAEPEVVFHLFDLAVSLDHRTGFTIVLDKKTGADAVPYVDTPLPFGNAVTKGFSEEYTKSNRQSYAQDVPEKIREMIGLYKYGAESFYHKARNFYRQGKFMEDYEDDAPWNGDYQRYFTTYHDLNVRQLRGYFTWRTFVRKGVYRPIALSLAYMYVYELLCGIGADSPEDTLRKLRSFEEEYIYSGVGDLIMGKNLRRWCFEYAVLHDFPKETVLQYADPDSLRRDRALTVLKKPEACTDDEVFSALSTFAGKKLEDSPVLRNTDSKGKHLFSELWRYLSEHYKEDGKSIFTACFGRQRSYLWHPLCNAVYYEEVKQEDREFFLNECRSYQLQDGSWIEKRYEKLYFDMEKLREIIHESDRLFRKYLKAGRCTKEKPKEGWVTPYVEAVLKEDKRAEMEAARPEIRIDFSELDKIRLDAIVTRDSLLVEEEITENESPVVKEQDYPDVKERGDQDAMEQDYPDVKEQGDQDAMERDYPDANKPDGRGMLISGSAAEGLDALHLQLLSDLIAGKPVERRISDERLMPSVVTDTINEALFDEIGDNILECDGRHITLVEEYREDIIEALGGHGK